MNRFFIIVLFSIGLGGATLLIYGMEDLRKNREFVFWVNIGKDYVLSMGTTKSVVDQSPLLLWLASSNVRGEKFIDSEVYSDELVNVFVRAFEIANGVYKINSLESQPERKITKDAIYFLRNKLLLIKIADDAEALAKKNPLQWRDQTIRSGCERKKIS